jgi:uncharacterized protein (UPF0212 family)
MPYARIVTIQNGTAIRTVKLEDGQTTYAVNQIACTLESIITEDLNILKIEVDYTGCDDSDNITNYEP